MQKVNSTGKSSSTTNAGSHLNNVHKNSEYTEKYAELKQKEGDEKGTIKKLYYHWKWSVKSIIVSVNLSKLNVIHWIFGEKIAKNFHY
jgi:hypothetical protein